MTLRVRAHAVDGSAIGFEWSAAVGTFGVPVTSAHESVVSWNAPAPFTGPTHVVAIVRDASGNGTPVDFTLGVSSP